MVRYAKLKGRIREMGFTYAKVAKELGLRRESFGRKLAGKTAFSVPQAFAICDMLEIPREDMHIFFS